MGTVLYFIKETFRGFFEAKIMTFISVMIISVTLFFLGLALLGFKNIFLKLEETEKRNTINVYLTDNIAKESDKLKLISSQLLENPNIDKIKFISKQDAWEKFKEEYGAEMLESVENNPLPASFEVYVKAGSDIKSIEQYISLITGVESIQYSYEWISKLIRFRKIFYIVSVVVLLVLLVALYSVISNTIKLTIYARKELVRNMHYVGATEFFIKAPFFLEGILQGVIGGSIAATLLFALKFFMSNFMDYEGLNIMLPGIILTGAIFGWLGSLDAVKKFMV